jgi:tRNA (guanine37-N1)-methyltransferase
VIEIDVLTLFPGWFAWMYESRPVRNAIEAGRLSLRAIDLREFAPGPYRAVDDSPYGGGAGMVIRVDVVAAALEETYGAPAERVRDDRAIVVLTPAGRQLTDAVATEYAGRERITILCGRYEGFDHRVHEHLATEELSVGPYVLSGGEPAAMTVVDAVVRKIPGALGKEESHLLDSFAPGLGGMVEHPHYTRPETFRGWTVPSVLLSGDHAAVERWRREHLRSSPGTGPVCGGGEGSATMERLQERMQIP